MAISTSKVWEEFSDRLKGFILQRVHNEDDADDILQDVFYKIHKNINNLNDQDKLRSWVYQITRNTIIDYYRHQGKVVEEPLATDGEGVGVDLIPDGMDDISACLKPMIEALPDKYRQAIMLTEYEELSQKELAAKLGLSFSGAKSRIQRARSRLKQALLDCCHFEFDRLGNILDYQPKENTCPDCSGGPPKQ